jgi:DNA-binding MarR family transcriptional regulator
MEVTATAVPTIPDAELASRLRVALWRATRRLRRESDPGMTLTAHAALVTIETHAPITPGQLATHEGVRRPTMTRTIQGLLERGLITRAPDPLDGRVSWLQVSPEGKRILNRARLRSDAFLSKRLKHLTPQERETLTKATQLLDRLAEADR